MIQALGADSPNESLGVGVGVRCSKWRLQNPGTLRAQDLVEACHELRVAVTNKELGVESLVHEITR